jgi:hypothetical protein
MLAQSSPLMQVEPPTQPWQLPPQSTSVSSPLTLPSMQYAGVGVIVGAKVGDSESHTPFAQLKLPQSLSTLQLAPPAQPWQLLPPQSTSVSSPFFLPSMQKASVGLSVGVCVGATESHTPSVHPMLAQSSPLAHAPPPAQPWQLPPQSTSVSSPLMIPSTQ